MGDLGVENSNNIDTSVGGLVWVRRRNGSWWPGRILDPDELPRSCLVSPRSGTPVKLLGREDASVDWYNLEKSIRVKAFRCGEYAECIEKAKAAAANSCKKAVKYARREDAIIQALELESARASKDCHGDFFSTVAKPNVEQAADVEDLHSPLQPDDEIEHMSEESNSSDDDSNSGQELSQSGVSFEEPNHIDVFKEHSVQEGRQRIPSDSEDDGTEGNTKRMRGLDDLSMGGVLSFKRKRSEVEHSHEVKKKKDRRRQLRKVLESSTPVTLPVMHEQLPSPTESFLSGAHGNKVSLESNKSKRTSLVLNNNSDSTGVSCDNGTSLIENGCALDAPLSDSKPKEYEISSMSGLPENDSFDGLFDVPLTADDTYLAGLASISRASQKLQVVVGAQSSQSSQVEALSGGDEEFHESGSTSVEAVTMNNLLRTDKGTSKWQSKKKRNTRHKSKIKKDEPMKFVDMDINVESNDKPVVMGIEARVAFSLGSGQKVNDKHVVSSSGQLLETELETSKECSSKDISHKEFHTRGQIADLVTPQRLLPYRQSRSTMNPKYRMSGLILMEHGDEDDDDGSLYDVHLDAEMSFPHSQHVPYISLMSKSYGKPIIGYPLTVEVLDEASYDLLMNSYTSDYELEDSLVENLDAYLSREAKKISGGSKFSNKLITAQQKSRAPIKSAKHRKNGSLSKKTRKLSSLTACQIPSQKEKNSAVERLKGQPLACIPLKVVFSRINAAFQ